MKRPFGQIVAVGELHEAPARLFLGEELRTSGAVRDEHEPPHRVVVRRHEEERMVVDRRMGGDLPDAGAGRRVAEPACLGRPGAALSAAAGVHDAVPSARGRINITHPRSATNPAQPAHHHGCPVGAKMMASATAQKASRSIQLIGVVK